MRLYRDMPFLDQIGFPLFPRYLSNALKWAANHAPGFGIIYRGFLKGSEEIQIRSALKKGFKGLTGPERETWSRMVGESMTGSVMLMAALALRSGKYAGEKWNELESEQGETFELSGALGPGALYFFIAEVMRASVGEAHMTEDDIRRAAGIGSRVNPTSNMMLREISKRISTTSLPTGKGAAYMAQRIVGEFLGRFTAPLNEIGRFQAAFSGDQDTRKEAALSRTSAEDPFYGPIIRNFPVGFRPVERDRTDLPPYRAIGGRTEGETFSSPRWRLIGFGTKLKLPVQREIDRLGLNPWRLRITTHDPEMDTIANENLVKFINGELLIEPGIAADVGMDPGKPMSLQDVVQGKGYKEIPTDVEKGDFITRYITAAKRGAIGKTLADNERFREPYFNSPRLMNPARRVMERIRLEEENKNLREEIREDIQSGAELLNPFR